MSVTSNVFYWRSMPWHCSSSPAVQTEEQCVTTWHLCSCDIIKMLIWQPTNYESRREDTGKHLALALLLTWPFYRDRAFFPSTSPLCSPLFLCFFYSKLHPLHPKVNPIRWMFCHGSDFFLCHAVVIYWLLTSLWILGQSETHIVIKSIKFLSL